MKSHRVKLSSEFYELERSGIKPFTIRFNDRNYKQGDILTSQEYSNNNYTGKEFNALITYVFNDIKYGLQDGYVILGLKTLND